MDNIKCTSLDCKTFPPVALQEVTLLKTSDRSTSTTVHALLCETKAHAQVLMHSCTRKSLVRSSTRSNKMM